MNITLKGDLPEALAQAFLQAIRDFDTANPGCHFAVTAVSDLNNADIGAMLDAIDPPFTFREKIAGVLREDLSATQIMQIASNASDYDNWIVNKHDPEGGPAFALPPIVVCALCGLALRALMLSEKAH